MSLTVTITGTEQLLAALERIGEQGRTAAAAGLYQEAEYIIADAKEHYVPVDHGQLRNSGFVKPPKVDDKDITVQLGFGGTAKAYAIAVHEHLSEHSPRSWVKAESAGRPVKFSPSGAGPKYLERPLLDVASKLAARLGDRIRGAFK